MKTFKEMIDDYNERVYQGRMPAYNIRRLQDLLEIEDMENNKDYIPGFDNGEELQANEN